MMKIDVITENVLVVCEVAAAGSSTRSKSLIVFKRKFFEGRTALVESYCFKFLTKLCEEF